MEEIKKRITISTDAWKANPNHPDGSVRISVQKNAHGSLRTCWYLDSRNDTYSSLTHDLKIEQDEIVYLMFWAEFGANTGSEQFLYEVYYGDDYENRTVLSLDRHSPYISGNVDQYYLFMVPFIQEKDEEAHLALTCNHVQITLFLADDNDYKQYGDPKAYEPTGMISHIRPLCLDRERETSTFCSAMVYICECLKMDASIFDYRYFAIEAGEFFTQIHCDELGKVAGGLCDSVYDEEMAANTFSAIGFEYSYYDTETIKTQSDKLMDEIITSIDHNIPVLVHRGGNNTDFALICGYDLDTKGAPFRIMADNSEELSFSANLLKEARSITVVGKRIGRVNLVRFYVDLARRIPSYIERAPRDGMTFGTKAFRAWADSLTDGSIAALGDDMDDWSVYGYNLAMVGKHSYAGTGMLKDILRKCPGFADTYAYPIMQKAMECFDRMNDVTEELFSQKYDFEIPDDMLRDTEYMSGAAKLIEKYMHICEEITHEVYTHQVRKDETLWDGRTFHVVKCYKQSVPAIRFIGLHYTDADRVEGTFAAKWTEWQQRELSTVLGEFQTPEFISSFENIDSEIGMMRSKEGEPFSYWIGKFVPADTPVPEGYGFETIDFPAGSLGVGWIKAKPDHIYCHEAKVLQALNEKLSCEAKPDETDGGQYYFERYVPERFGKEDDLGRITLDICYFVE